MVMKAFDNLLFNTYNKGKNFVADKLGQASGVPIFSVDELANYKQALAGSPQATYSHFNGDKFIGGFGDTEILLTDYWTLRQRSNQLFTKNLYARGLIRRLITNEINKGLNLEAIPNSEILGLNDDDMNDWSENVENRFQIWADNPLLCDYKELDTFGKIQQDCRREALVGGDVLVINRFSRVNKLPNIELVRGDLVQTPLGFTPRAGNIIKHGIELDSRGRHVAFHVRQKDGTSKRVAAFGERTGRKTAWMVYGTDKRIDELRGQPLLSLILQSLKDVDRYRDAAQRKALINSMISVVVRKTQPTMGTRPIANGATLKSEATINDADGQVRNLNVMDYIPGTIVDELAHGEEIDVHSTAGTDINFAGFEAAIINGISWAHEIPPGILQLAFSSNYSASQGEIKEFKMYLDKSRSERANEFDKPIYNEWLLNEVLINKISAPGLLEAWRNPNQYDILGSWLQSDWGGAIKPNVDIKKEVAGYKGLESEGWITNDRAARELTGTKFSKNIKRLKKENQMKIDAMTPFLEAEKEFPGSALLNSMMASAEPFKIEAIEDIVKEALDDNVTD